MNQIILNSGVLEEIFKTHKSFVAKDESRPLLKFIRFEIEGKILRTIAVSGYEMIVMESELNEKVSKDFQFHLKPFALPKNYENVEISTYTERVVLKFNFKYEDCFTYSFKETYGEFIEWKNVLPQTSDNLKFFIDSNRFGCAMNAIGTTCSSGVWMKFAENSKGIDQAKPVVISGETHTGAKITSIVLPMRFVR